MGRVSKGVVYLSSCRSLLLYNMAALNADCLKCKFCQTVVNVTNATEQVVDGRVYQFHMGVQESDKCLSSECMEAKRPSGSQCPPSDNAKPYWCYVSLVIKSWSVPTHFVQNLT